MNEGLNDSIGIVLACSEVVGFAKTGGLADVAGSLPRALAKQGHRCAVMMPLYRAARLSQQPLHPTEHVLAVSIGDRVLPARLWQSTLPNSEVPVFLIEQPALFERDDPHTRNTIYQQTNLKGEKIDYPDNCERYTFFCRAVMEAIPAVGFPVDILHANDWQTGLLPVYLREVYRHHPAYRSIRSVFTIHNISYQGVFPAREYPLTGLDWKYFNYRQLEFYGQFNFLKAGLVFADWINTVSPTYAREIQTTYFGCGMEGILTERRDRLSGVVNGIDPDFWNPATDPYLPAHFSVDHFSEGKALCKKALQERFQLDVQPRLPLLGMVARLVQQKGVDLVIKSFRELMDIPVQLVILGEGDRNYMNLLEAYQKTSPRQFGLSFTFDEGLAHLIEAGSDLYLMPSLYEPSGLNQLYSLRYGTPPIVRSTGGLADTITDTNEDTLQQGTATGFRFTAYTSEALLGAVRRAVDMYSNQPQRFYQVVRQGMMQDWSWDRAAIAYEEIYRRLIAEREGLPFHARQSR